MGRKAEDLIGKVFNDLTVIKRVDAPEGKKSAYWECVCVCGNKTIASTTSLKNGKKKSCGCRISRRAENLIGKRFGRLVVFEKDLNYKNKWLCKCDCGNVTSVFASNLKRGLTQSCGCYHKESVSKARLNDLTGKRFGRLVVLNKTTHNDSIKTFWRCKCDCGNEVDICSSSLITGNTKSCGCLKRELTSKLLSLDLTGKRFGKLLVIKRDGTFKGSDGTQYSQWLCKCDCGTQKSIRGHDLIRGSVKSCGCMISRGEEEIRKVLNEYNLLFDTQYWFDDLKTDKGWPLMFDFALLHSEELVCLIEYQGQQHFDDSYGWFGEQQRNITDQMKRDYCKMNHIPLYEITYKYNIKEAIIAIISDFDIYK